MVRLPSLFASKSEAATLAGQFYSTTVFFCFSLSTFLTPSYLPPPLCLLPLCPNPMQHAPLVTIGDFEDNRRRGKTDA